MNYSRIAFCWTPALLGFVLLSVACTAASAQAQAPVALSLDTTTSFGGSTFEDETVFADDGSGSVVEITIAGLSPAVDVNAYDRYLTGARAGEQLLSLDSAANVGDGVTAEAGDVVRLSGASRTLVFDASASGIPNGIITDAAAIHASSDLLLSFDTTLVVSGLTVEDEDLVRFDGGSYSVFFDGSAEGIDFALDLDAADFRSVDGHLLLSFDGSGFVGGVAFEDEDILEFDPGSSSWALSYDGSVEHPGIASADLVAVPETKALMSLAIGCVALSTGFRTRRPKRSGRA